MICDLIKFFVVSATPTKEAKDIAKAIFNDFILIHDPMKSILTDRGTEYKNEVMTERSKM